MSCSDTDKFIQQLFEYHREAGRVAKDQPEEYNQAIKDMIFNRISEEIISLEKEKIIESANEQIKKNKIKAKLNEIKWIIVEGILAAFIVGLVVNQVTELIANYKGFSPQDVGVIWKTWGITGGLFSVLVIWIMYRVFSDVLSFIKENIGE